MVINHNLSAMFADRQLGLIDQQITTSIEKMSSGLRINRAGDDASGLAVSEKLRSQIRGLNQADRNIQNAVSFMQTTEGYLEETTDILQRLRELSVQSANGIYTQQDRAMIQVEVSQLISEINRIASQAQFNGLNMLTGRFAQGQQTIMQFQVGANMDQSQRVYIGTMTAAALALTGAQGISISTPERANAAIGLVDAALQRVSAQRANLGAYQNRFDMASRGVTNASENLQAAESQIRDVDMAAEMVGYVRDQILEQSGTAMLAQANAKSKYVLQLF